MVECPYPVCDECEYDDCIMEPKDIQALLKRRRYQSNPQKYREIQRAYREKQKEKEPKCDECESCVRVKKEKLDGERRVCVVAMRLVEQKVSTCPHWCVRR